MFPERRLSSKLTHSGRRFLLRPSKSSTTSDWFRFAPLPSKSPDRNWAPMLSRLAALEDQSRSLVCGNVRTAIAFDLFQDFGQQLLPSQGLLSLLVLSPSFPLPFSLCHSGTKFTIKKRRGHATWDQARPVHNSVETGPEESESMMAQTEAPGRITPIPRI